MAKGTISKRTVDALKPGVTLFDDRLSGFLVRRQGAGAKRVYAVKYKVNARQRYFTLGEHGALTPEQARSMAMDVKGRIARGEDPQAERAIERARRAHTFKELAEQYLADHARPNKRASSIENDERMLRMYLLPTLGALPIQAITGADLNALRSQLRDKPFMANRVRALASKMFALAIKWGFRSGDNPARMVEKFKEAKRVRRITGEEYARLFRALNEAQGKEHPSILLAIRLLALTGARAGEILTLKWEHVDFEASCLRLPQSKTGAKTIPLGAPALTLLAAQERVCDWVCYGRNLDGPYQNDSHPWGRIRAAAGLPDLRLHDLRHGFASMGVNANISLKLVGSLLGHAEATTTNRYAHMDANAAGKDAADRIAGAVAAAGEGRTADVVPIRKAPHKNC